MEGINAELREKWQTRVRTAAMQTAPAVLLVFLPVQAEQLPHALVSVSTHSHLTGQDFYKWEHGKIMATCAFPELCKITSTINATWHMAVTLQSHFDFHFGLPSTG